MTVKIYQYHAQGGDGV